MGFVNATFIMDRWHLRELGLLKIFGPTGYGLLKNHLHRLIGAMAEHEFDEVVTLALELLKSQTRRDDDVEQNFEKFVLKKQQYSNHCLQRVLGNLGQRGSVISKINHSSVLFTLNMEKSKTNKYCESPMVACRDLMKRQQKMIVMTNTRLFDMHLKMKIERAKLSREPDTAHVVNLRMAAKMLNATAYGRYKLRLQRVNEYECTKLQCKTVIVKSTRYPDAPPRIFDSFKHRCTCNDRIAHLYMCTHEILAKDGFHPDFFFLDILNE